MSRLIRYGNGESGEDCLSNTLTRLLGCRYPIMLAGMGGVSRHGLAAAVAEAGGFGCLGMVREEPDFIRDEVEKFRALSKASFGINLIPAATERGLLKRQLKVCVELEVPCVVLFWDIDRETIAFLKQAGTKVIYQVCRHQDARSAIDAGVDALIVQGKEAGGHVRGNSPLFEILPEIAGYSPIPLIAAGGISKGEELVRAINMGAAGVCCGTLFMATEESNAHDYHKQLIVESHGDDTVITDKFWLNWHEPAPVRVLKCCLNNIENIGNAYSRVVALQDGKPVYLYSTDSPLKGVSGQLELMALYAGKSCSGVSGILKVSTVMNRLLKEAGINLAVSRDNKMGPSSSETPETDRLYQDGAGN